MRDAPPAPARPLAILPAAAALAVLTALTAVALVLLGPFDFDRPGPQIAAIGLQWLVFIAAVLLLRRAPTRAIAPLVLAGALATGVAALPSPSATSTDAARYAWDGIVTDAGVSPYRYVPADAHLAALQPAWLFPAGSLDAAGTLHCPAGSHTTPRVAKPGEQCTRINRPRVPTIYPPVAEAAFALVRLPVPPSARYLPMQLLGLVGAIGTTALLLAALRRRGLDPRRAAYFAWCPLTAAEAVNNAHVDGLAVLLTLGATLLVAGGRPARGGLLLGLAVATKFTPLLAAPSLVRRRGWRVALAAAGAVVAVYLPFVAWSGIGVLGYLPGYLNEEGYDSGARSALLGAVLPGGASTIAAVVVVAAVAGIVALRGDPASPWTGQLAVIGTALLALSPHYSWYGLLLLPAIAMTGRWEWLAVVFVFVPVYLVGAVTPTALVLLLAAAIAVGGTALRASSARRRTP